jgi:hypothetical protein
MFERRVLAADIRLALANAQVVERYDDDSPLPSVLLLGWIGSLPVHLVVGEDAVQRRCVIITVYFPDTVRWERDWRTRRPR